MRISFDVDDTLVCYGGGVPSEQFVPWPLRPWFHEPVRRGTRDLLRELARLGCEPWIYTTSYREPLYLKLWFRSFGVRLGGVVNQHVHERHLQGRRWSSYAPSKYPPAFGIDLHVDDLDGVREEGLRYGFDVVVVSPADPDWAAKVLEVVCRRTAR
jgi:hypothetical protein